jgi:DNA adenine methylase
MFRYPGGKSKLKNQIVARLNEMRNGSRQIEFREPFFGGGSIGSIFLEKNPNLKKIWINDFDLGIASIWTTIINNPAMLKSKVQEFVPSISAFDDFKTELLTTPLLLTSEEIAEFGFKKLAIHQISYSGLGTKSGGPLGGRDQKSQYKIDCRWSPKYICKKIDLLHERFSKISFIRQKSCTNLDFSELIQDERTQGLIYLDPPYFIKGNDLYQHGFSVKDHERLANSLKETGHRWLLSYDDCPEIRDLYSWANIQEIDGVSYTITALKDKQTGERKSRTKMELLISV